MLIGVFQPCSLTDNKDDRWLLVCKEVYTELTYVLECHPDVPKHKRDSLFEYFKHNKQPTYLLIHYHKSHHYCLQDVINPENKDCLHNYLPKVEQEKIITINEENIFHEN